MPADMFGGDQMNGISRNLQQINDRQHREEQRQRYGMTTGEADDRD